MRYEEDLGRLEQYVEKMLAGYNDLKRKNDELQASLQQKEEDNKDLQEQVSSLRENRNIIRNRVTGLIGKIEEWEQTQTAADLQVSGPETVEHTPSTEEPPRLFSTGFELKTGESR